MIVIDDLESARSRPAFLESLTPYRAESPKFGSLVRSVSWVADDTNGALRVDPEGDPPLLAVDDVINGIADRSRMAAQRFPASARAQVNLGLALLNAGDLAGAAEALGRVDLVKEPAARLAFGRVRAAQGRLAEAEEIFKALALSSPRDATLVAGLAGLALSAARFEEAVELWRRSTELRPGEALDHYWLGISLLGLSSRTNEAVHELRTATRLDPRSAAFHNGLAIAYVVGRNLDRAEASFRRALKLDAHLPSAIEGLVAILTAKDRSGDALSLAEAFTLARPNDPRPHELVAQIQYSRREYSLARIELFRSLQLMSSGVSTPDALARVSNNVGACYCQLEDLRQGKRFFLRSIDASPTSALFARRNLADVHEKLGELDDAVRVAQECRSLHPTDEQSRIIYARVLIRAKQVEPGIAIIREWIAAGSATPDAYTFLGAALADELSDYEGAIRALADGLELHPGDPMIGNGLAYAYLMSGKPSEARRVLTLIREPGTHEKAGILLLATRGLLNLWEGDLENGARLYESSAQAAMPDRRLEEEIRQKCHLELARAFLRRGDRQQAVREVQRGRELRGRSSFERELATLARELDLPERPRTGRTANPNPRQGRGS